VSRWPAGWSMLSMFFINSSLLLAGQFQSRCVVFSTSLWHLGHRSDGIFIFILRSLLRVGTLLVATLKKNSLFFIFILAHRLEDMLGLIRLEESVDVCCCGFDGSLS